MNKPTFYKFFSLFLFIGGFYLTSSFIDNPKDKLSIIKNGKFVNVIKQGRYWEEKENYVLGRVKRSMLYSSKFIDDADFKMHARISLRELNKTEALFSFFNNHFGFDSQVSNQATAINRLFIYIAARDEKIFFDSSAVHIEAGKAFDFDLTYNNKTLTFSINNVDVAIVQDSIFKMPMQGLIAFRPWKNEIRIYDWWIEGRFSDFPDNKYLFERGEAGYSCFRIPNIIQTKEGTLLALAEGRMNSCQDLGDTDIVIKRSEDEGLTWDDLRVLVSDSIHSCIYPTIIEDQTTGDLVMLYIWNHGKDLSQDIYANKSIDTKRIFKIHSRDNGKTWSEPQQITDQVKLKRWISYGLGYTSPIQLKNGPNKNRMIIPAYHSKNGTNTHYVHLIYSDDLGTTWQIGAQYRPGGLNETELVEIDDGQILLSLRTDSPDKKERRKAISINGGLTINNLHPDPYIKGTICHGSFAREWNKETNHLYYSYPGNHYFRENLFLWQSSDTGTSWQKNQTIYKGCSAYSDLLILEDGRIACLFECGHLIPYEGILFKWLDVSK